ncbi:MAG: helicase [Gemmatimonadetes bacterium]|nr:helicase [Gemmatimonadota bacterium]
MSAELRLAPEAAERIRTEIRKAGGREVCFIAHVDPARVVTDPRAVARGNYEAVLVAARDARSGDVMIHNHPSGTLEPSEADFGVAARLYDLGLGTAITDNDVTTLYVVVEPPVPKERVALDVEALETLLGPEGPLPEVHPRFEDRPGQREVLRVLATRFNERGVALIEAGTGTGKSLAYLVPAAVWAVENEERTVVSTNTINLQEQLVGKDLPLVARVLGREVRWALVKGRGNYVSIRRARLAAESIQSLFDEDRSDEIDRLLAWLETTADGSLSDLPFTPSSDLWDEVQSDADVCLRAKCPHFQTCFYQRSRRRAAAAELLVVNHHLLFTDLAVRRATDNWTQAAVLPPYRHVILDEAHNVEDAATTHLGVDVSRIGVARLLARLETRGRGLLRALGDEAGGSEEADQVRDLIEDRVRPALSTARAWFARLVDAVDAVLPAEETTARLGTPPLGELAERETVREALDGTLVGFAELGRHLARVRALAEEREALVERLGGRLLDVQSVERRVDAAATALRTVLDADPGDRDFVRWVERRGRLPRGNLVFAAAPIDVGPLLRSALFEKVDSAALLSATLTTDQGFRFVRSRIGLETSSLEGNRAVVEHVAPSPFDFTSQALLTIPTDVAPPETSSDTFQRQTAEWIRVLAGLSGGGVLALFTSHRSLRKVAELLRAAGIESRWPLFVQGDGDRSRLLDAFRDARNGVLLGTASFWEGVDVPGDPLRALLLEKLPFRVPSEPITAARLEALEAAGRNSFQEFMLPHAALRLKQGFGRLIRSRSDRGAVVLLDSRVLTRRYGRALRAALPPAPVLKGLGWEVERSLADFYGPDAGGRPRAEAAVFDAAEDR